MYEAAEHAERWPDFLAMLARVTHSDNGALVLHDLVNRSAVAIPYGYEPSEEQRYFEHYARLNPWIPKDDTPPTDGPIVRGEAIVPLADLRKTEFYADWAQKNNAVYSVMANLKMSNGKLLFLSLNRGEKTGEHPRHLETSLGLLLPHLRQAIYRQEQYARACALLAAADASVFIVDRDRRLLDMTPSAERLLKAGSYVSRSPRNQLRSIGRETDKELANALLQLLTTPFLKSVAVKLPSLVGPPAIAIVCLNKVAPPAALFLESSPTFVVNVVLPSQPPRMALDALMRLFKLTEAESRLVEALLTTGGGLRVASERLEITRNTAKTQLTTVFRKTGTNSQAKLLRLFGSAFTHSGDDS